MRIKDVLRKIILIFIVNPLDYSSKEKQDKARETSLNKKAQFIQRIFESDQVAFVEDLCATWEFYYSKLLYKIAPEVIKKNMTKFSENIVHVLGSTEYQQVLQEQNEDSLSEIRNSQSPNEHIPADLIRYHSVRFWYRQLRVKVSTLLFIITFTAIYTGFAATLINISSQNEKNITQNDILNKKALVISYRVPETGDYLVEVEGSGLSSDYYSEVESEEITTYSLKIGQPLIGNFVNQTDQSGVIQVLPGQNVRSWISDQQLFQIQSNAGESVSIEVNPYYANSTLSFELYDSKMISCDFSFISNYMVIEEKDKILDCGSGHTGPFYLAVTPSDTVLGISVPVSFTAFSKNYVEAPDDPLDSIYDFGKPGSYTKTQQNSRINGRFEHSQERDQYAFTAQQGQQLAITFLPKPANQYSDSLAIRLYRKTNEGLELLSTGHEDRQLEQKLFTQYLETDFGRSFLVEEALKSIGINGLRNYITSVGFLVFIFLVITIPMILIAINFFLSSRKYQESRILDIIGRILLLLQDEDILKTEYSKEALRKAIILLSREIKKISLINRVLIFSTTPQKVKDHITSLSKQVNELTVFVSIPNGKTMAQLRKIFLKLFYGFLTGSYGSLQFQSEIEISPFPWYTNILYFTRQNFWKLIGGMVLLAFTGFLSVDLWKDHINEFAVISWQLSRYIFLIIILFWIFNRWGTKKDTGANPSNFEGAVRLVLFFVVPFIFLDTLLKTEVIESVIKLLSAIKLF